MSSTRSVITVFFASPSDLQEERTASVEVVERFNNLYAKPLGFTVDLVRWEDVLPGMGRPQSQIDPHVRDCDIFIGLLWRKWGTPTGTFSSGFEEEYTIAKDRFESDGKPQLRLYFKKVDEGQLADPALSSRKCLDLKNE
jgi:hypothetical protein